MNAPQAANNSEFNAQTEAASKPRGRIDARGYIYLLQNDAFKDGWVKIGKSRRSGHQRAEELNTAAGTGIPKFHRCIFEVETLDCDRAERAVFERLRLERQGTQEFFIVDIALAEQVIREECSRVTREIAREVDEANALRAEELRQQRDAAQRSVRAPSPPKPPARPPLHTHRTAPSKPAPPSPDPRNTGQWVTPDQVAAAWAARRTAQADRVRRDAEHAPLEASPLVPVADNPHPEFRWMLLLIVILGIVAISL